jgi:hypothetical protein
MLLMQHTTPLFQNSNHLDPHAPSLKNPLAHEASVHIGRLSDLADPELLSATRTLVAEERRITALVLAYLEEVERRRLHLQRHSSLFEYCRKDLGYSESEANARISAMRLSREVPEVAVALEEGKLSLTNLVKAQVFFNQEKVRVGKAVSQAEKKELLQELEGKSTRECERLLAERSPMAVLPQERERALSGNHTQISFTADEKLMEELERIRALWGHEGKLGYAELIQKMAELTLKKIDPMVHKTVRSTEKPARARSAQSASQSAERSARDASTSIKPPQKSSTFSSPTETNKSPRAQEERCDKTSDAPPISSQDRALEPDNESDPCLDPPPEFVTPVSRHIPAAVQRAVWIRDQGRCTYRYTHNQQRCRSPFAVEYDHVILYSHGGPHTVDNLRLLCRAHHRARKA